MFTSTSTAESSARGYLWRAALLQFVFAAAVFAAAPAGWFGMRLNIDTDGNRPDPTVKSITIDGVFPDSPASQAHVSKGDEIVEAEGQPVAGGKAKALEALMKKPVGGSLHLKLKKESGETYSVVLVAARIPETRAP